MTKSTLASGSGLVVNLSPSPLGREGHLNTPSLEGTVFWFKDKGDGKQKTVVEGKLIILCAQGNSKCNWFCRCLPEISHLLLTRFMNIAPQKASRHDWMVTLL